MLLIIFIAMGVSWHTAHIAVRVASTRNVVTMVKSVNALMIIVI